MKHKKKGHSKKGKAGPRSRKQKKYQFDGSTITFHPRNHPCPCCDAGHNKVPRFFLRALLFGKRSPRDFAHCTRGFEQHRDYESFNADKEDEYDLERRTRKPAELGKWKKVMRNKARDEKFH